MTTTDGRRPRWLRRLFLIGGMLFLVGLPAWGWLVLVMSANNRAFREAVEEADRLDPGWRLDELKGKRRRIPEADARAMRLLLVLNLLGTPPWLMEEGFNDLRPEVQLSAEQSHQLREYLKEVDPALVEARALVDLPSGHSASRSLVHVTPTSPGTVVVNPVDTEIAALLRTDAILRAQDNDADGALADGRAALNGGRLIGDEPHTDSQTLVRMACATIAVGSMERTLAQGEPSQGSLAAAQRLLEDEAAEPLLLFALRAERAHTHGMLQTTGNDHLKPAEIVAAFGNHGLTGALQNLSLARTISRSHGAYLRLLTEAVEIAKLPVAEQPARLREFQDRGMERVPMAAVWLRNVTPVAQAFWQQQAALGCAATALAAERYRRANGRWPEGLADLVALQFLRRIPSDPYSGGPLRYRRLGDGGVIYSVGPDGQDDGGKLDRKNPTAWGSDIGFRLWDVGQRRQPWKAGVTSP